MVIKTDKKVLQKTNVKQKQTVNVKVQIGDGKKKRSRKPRKSGGGSGGGGSQTQSPYAQPYHPVYIQSGIPQEPHSSNALLEKLNSTISSHHEELKNSLLSKVPTPAPTPVHILAPTPVHTPAPTPVHTPALPSVHPSIPSSIPSLIPSPSSSSNSLSWRYFENPLLKHIKPTHTEKENSLLNQIPTPQKDDSESDGIFSRGKDKSPVIKSSFNDGSSLSQSEFRVGGNIPEGVGKTMIVRGMQITPKKTGRVHENEAGYIQNHTGRWVKITGTRGKYIKKLLQEK